MPIGQSGLASSAVFASYAFYKREAHHFGGRRKKEKKRWEGGNQSSYWWVFMFICVYMCLLEKHMSICHHEDYVSYLSIWKCVHSVSYVIHNVTSSTFDSDNWVASVYFIHACFLYPLLKRMENVHPYTNPVVIVHPVNAVLF